MMDLRSGFALGPWTVLPLESRLYDGAESRRVQPKSMDVLLCLAAAGGDVVERDALLREVWGERAVSDEPLTRCIGELRRALGDDSASPEFIQTIPKRGYRLLQPPMPTSEEPSAGKALAAPWYASRIRLAAVALGLVLIAVLFKVGIERSLDVDDSGDSDVVVNEATAGRSIAVLPFADMSADQDQEFMGDGIAEELLNLLARIRGLRVISRSSSFSLKDTPIDARAIARKFDVAYILEGSVRTSGDRIRVTAQLVDGRTDSHVWSETYERGLDDVFAIQDEIAQAVVGKLQITLLGEAPSSRPTDPEAYALFLEGRSLHEQPVGDSILKAIELYRAALEIDPDYVPAWVWLAAAYDDTVNSHDLPRDAVVRLARDAIDRALEIDPDDPLALGMGAVLTVAWDRDLAVAAAQMQRAIDLDPSNPILLRWAAIILTELGRHEQAVGVMEYLFERDPVGNITRINLAETYLNAGRFDDAVRICEIEVALSTETSPCGSRLVLAYLYAGDAAAAMTLLDRMPASSRVYTRLAPMVNLALGRQTAFEDSLEILRQACEAGDTGLCYWVANTFAFAEDPDALFAWLEHSRAEGTLGLVPGTAFFAAYEDDPRWRRLKAELGLSSADLDAIRLDPPILNSSR
jgi:TolB-like protein/DNA-binding winged helix-turn-helix (wHTH) protein/tetratricopeptide (TPR) repeat protein